MNTFKNPTLYLIDGSASIYRAYYAIKSLSTSKGFPTNAIYGFTAMLVKLFQDHKPSYVGMVFDSKGPTFRHEMFEAYKEHRVGMPDDLIMQLPYLRKIVEGFNLRSVECEGCEADDIIGTVTKQARAEGMTVIIVSVDKDFCQLVDLGVMILDPRNNTIMQAQEVQELFGVDPKKVVDVLGLAGDPSDNIPGVAGIGRKTAAKLIQQYASIDNIYQHLDEITPKGVRDKLAQGYDNARLSRDLATIKTDVPVTFSLDQFSVTHPDFTILEPIFRELEFTSFLHTLVPPKTALAKTYSQVLTEEDLDQLIKNARSLGTFAFALDSTAASPHDAAVKALALSFEPHHAYYISLDSAPVSRLSSERIMKSLSPLFESAHIRKVGHDVKHDCILLHRNGIRSHGFGDDVMIASYLLNPSRRKHNLEDLAVEYLDEHLAFTEHQLSSKGKAFPVEAASDLEWKPLCERADAIGHLSQILAPRLREANLERLYDEIEMPLMDILARMELAGVKVDPEVLSKISEELDILLQNVEQQVYSLAGETFNINSPQQLGVILFEKLNLPVLSRGKNGYSTGVDVLTRLAHIHELPSLILEYRRFTKLKSTYIDVLPKLIRPQTGRVHTTFNQTITATGRLSSSDPNLQNIPVRGEWGKKIRQAFVADQGNVLVGADYSQIELRIMAHLSADDNLKEAFQQNEDVHTRTAAELFHVSPQGITPEMRRIAKVVNFGVMYGMSHMGLSQELRISRKAAADYINSYFERHEGVKRYTERMLNLARERGYVETLSGRVRHLPEINSRNRVAREAAERIAINTPIQGTAADIIKIAMINIDRRLQREHLDSSMILQIHDELVFEAAEKDVPALTALAREEMERAVNLDVPIRVAIHCGRNWDEAH